jgi:hypothetical protein
MNRILFLLLFICMERKSKQLVQTSQVVLFDLVDKERRGILFDNYTSNGCTVKKIIIMELTPDESAKSSPVQGNNKNRRLPRIHSADNATKSNDSLAYTVQNTRYMLPPSSVIRVNIYFLSNFVSYRFIEGYVC